MRLTFAALPTPCPDAQPTQAPALYLDAGNALRWNDGTGTMVVLPTGTCGTASVAAHNRSWNPETCVDLSNGVTIRPGLSDWVIEQTRDTRPDRAALIGALDISDPAQWRGIIAQAVIDAGGTYPLQAGQIQGGVAQIALYGITATGRDEAEAIRNWICAARVSIRPRRLDSAYCGKPRNHAEEIANLRAAEGRIE